MNSTHGSFFWLSSPSWKRLPFRVRIHGPSNHEQSDSLMQNHLAWQFLLPRWFLRFVELLMRVIPEQECSIPYVRILKEREFFCRVFLPFLITCFSERMTIFDLVHFMELLNEEIWRQERIIRIFPNEDSAIGLIWDTSSELHEQWSTGKSAGIIQQLSHSCNCAVTIHGSLQSGRKIIAILDLDQFCLLLLTILIESLCLKGAYGSVQF